MPRTFQQLQSANIGHFFNFVKFLPILFVFGYRLVAGGTRVSKVNRLASTSNDTRRNRRKTVEPAPFPFPTSYLPGVEGTRLSVAQIAAAAGSLGGIKRYYFAENLRRSEETVEQKGRGKVRPTGCAVGAGTERRRDGSNFRAERSRLDGKNIIRGMVLSFWRDNARQERG